MKSGKETSNGRQGLCRYALLNCQWITEIKFIAKTIGISAEAAYNSDVAPLWKLQISEQKPSRIHITAKI